MKRKDKLLANDKQHNDKKDRENSALYDRGMELAYKGYFAKAIEILLPLADMGRDDAACNVGVCYERLGNLDKAKEYYQKSNTYDGKCNLLRLYDNERIKFDKKSYMNACKYLMQWYREEGFLYLAYYYENEKYGGKNIGKAIEQLKLGMSKCKRVNGLIFEYAYLLETDKKYKDKYKSHAFYQLLLNTDFTVAQYNYALQCWQGKGCEKDIDLAIKWFTKSAEGNYVPAMEKLVEIYSDEKTKDLEKLNYWKEKIKEAN